MLGFAITVLPQISALVYYSEDALVRAGGTRAPNLGAGREQMRSRTWGAEGVRGVTISGVDRP